MIYYKSSQPVPGKGDAWTYYECDDNETVLRTLTYITATDEVTRVPDPIVTKLYRPEMLRPAEEAEFTQLWGEG